MSSAQRLILRPFTIADEPEAMAAQEELKADNFEFLLETTPGQTWAEFVSRLGEISQGVNVAADRVPADLLAADVDGQLVGRVSIRHNIEPDFLRDFGGHIGYCVRPAFRRQGYASAILRAALARTRELGIDQALVTCDDSNVGSAATIESCGGVLEKVTDFKGTPWRRYWVPTS
jgi:predicted acetyltransferase